MLRAIVDFSIRFRGVVIALACVATAYGAWVSVQSKLDVFPDFAPAQVTIQTEAPGLSPDQVETLVTQPVENAVGGSGSIESIRSQSIAGLSIITVVFREGTDVFNARQMVSERLSEVAGGLPDGVDAPKMLPLTSTTMDLLKIGLVSDRLTPMELRSFADWTLRPRLQAVPGVASVENMGGEVRQLQVQIDPGRLTAYDLTVGDVLDATQAATGVRGAGFVENENQRIVLHSEGQVLTPAELGEAVVAQRGTRTIRLREVATALEAAAPREGDAIIQGRPGVLVKLLSQYGVNTLEVTQAVEASLDGIRPALAAQGITMYPRIHRPATFIETALTHMRDALLVGGALVVLVLFLFLLNLRTAFISVTAIPLSLLAAVVVLDHLGYTLNTITLGGFAIAIGVVVDDAIIGVENVWRRLRENAAAEAPAPPLDVVLAASLEVRSPIVYATFVVILVFLPVLTMSGLQGAFFAPLALSYTLATLASLLVALTLTPALCAVLLPSRAARKTSDPAPIRALKRGYRRLVAGALPHAALVVAVGLVLCGGALGLLPTFGGEFLPEFREGHFVLQVNASPGTSVAEMDRLGERISGALLRDKRIATVEQQVGRAELSEDPWGPYRSEFHVELRAGLTGEQERDVQRGIREVLAGIPGINSDVLTFLGDRIGETISGETAAVVVNLFGDDLDLLDAKAAEVAAVLGRVPGAADVRIAAPPGSPETVITLRRERLQQLGFRTLDVLEALRTLYQGAHVAQTYEGNRVFDVVVILDPALRRDPETIGGIMLANAGGTRVALRELADTFPATARFMVLHDGARRRQTVTCNVEGRDVATFTADAQRAVTAGVSFPPGLEPEFGGTEEARTQARNEILLNSGVAAVGILLLLAMVFRNARNLLLVLANLPFALVGGVLAAYLSGGSLSIGSLVGFVTLFGITMRNSVLMISHFDHLTSVEGMAWGPAAAVRGAGERIVPILMTALVTGLGLLPIALASGQAGGEIEGPMAVVILGGLATSTLLNLLVLPTLALRFGRFRKSDERENAAARADELG